MSTACNLSLWASKGWIAGAHLKELHPLQNLAAKCIWEHQQKFDHPDLDVNVFCLIPKTLRGYLLDEFIPLVKNGHHSYGYDAVCRLLTRLLCEDPAELHWPIKNLRLTPGMTFKLWNCLLEKCHLHLQAMNYSNNDSSSSGVENPYIETMVIKMYPNLQVLRLHGNRCVFNDERLSAIAKNMPNLRVLEVSELDVRVSAEGFGVLSNMQHLEEFIFEIPEDAVKIFKQLILQHLPKLCCVGQMSGFYSYLFNQRLYCAVKPVTLGLQEVTMYNARSLPDGILLPNLTILKLVFAHKNFQFDSCDLRLSKVSELVLEYASKNTYINLFRHLGRQLKKLTITVVDSIPLGQIFNLCPYLEFFSYRQDYSSTISSVSPIKLDTLQKLKELEMYTVDGVWSRGHEVVEAYSGVLLHLLQAPQLRKLMLRWLSVGEREMDEIVRSLQQREILQQLQLVEIEPLTQNDGDSSYWKEHHQIELLLSEMALNCPNLIHGHRNMHF